MCSSNVCIPSVLKTISRSIDQLSAQSAILQLTPLASITAAPLTYLEDFALVNHTSFLYLHPACAKRFGETASSSGDACKSRWKIIGWRLGDREGKALLSRKCYICAVRCSSSPESWMPYRRSRSSTDLCSDYTLHSSV